MQYDKQYKDIYKIAHTILFFLNKDMHHFGITKLMKLLFYADKYHLEKYKKTIFNNTYTKLEHGPVPETIHNLIHDSLSLQLDAGYPLEFENEAKIMNYFLQIDKISTEQNKTMIIFTANKDVSFNADYFSQTELEILNQIANDFKYTSTQEVSDLSHDTNAWKSVDMRQPIPTYRLADNIDDRKFINFLDNHQHSFRENYERFKLEK